MNPAMQTFVLGYRPPKRQTSNALALVQLGVRANHAGRVEMSHKQLAARIGLTDHRQSQNIVRHLAAAGLLLIEHQFAKSGAQLANIYRILAPWVRAQLDGEANTRTPGTAGTDTPGRGRESTAAQPRGDGARRPPPRGCIHSMPPCDECLAKWQRRG